MKKRILNIILLSSLFFVSSCGEIKDENPKVTSKPQESTSITPPEEDITFSTTLTYNGDIFPGIDDDIKAVWQNKNEYYEAAFDENGIASVTGLSGEYYVSLTKCPKNYTYDPNAIIVNNENPTSDIKLYKLNKPSSGKGKDLFNNVYKINNFEPKYEGQTIVFETTISSASEVVYYEFEPKVAGTYKIESMVSIFDNTINPKALKYYEGPQSTAYLDQEVDSGGSLLDGGYTKNFSFEVNFAESHINSTAGSNVAKFGIKAEISDLIEYPVTISYKMVYCGGYTLTKVNRVIKYAEEIYYKRDANGNYIYDNEGNHILNYVKVEDPNDYVVDIKYDEAHNSTFYNQLIDSSYVYDGVNNRYLKRRFELIDGNYVQSPTGKYILESTMLEVQKTSSYQELGNYSKLIISNGSLILSEDFLYYNEDDGYYYYVEDGQEYRLCVNLTGTSLFFDTSLVHFEDEGGSLFSTIATNEYDEDTGLRIIENYKYFLDAEYAPICNSDGLCYVNKELKEFLDKVSNAGNFFFDGNGWCENTGVYATEESQWLFACGFYKTN